MGLSLLFICLGNICRSPAAEGVMKYIVDREGREAEFVIDSAGIGGWHVGQLPDYRMRRRGAARGYDFSSRARQFSADDFGCFDLILVMDRDNYNSVMRIARNDDDRQKVRMLPDFMTNHPGQQLRGNQGVRSVGHFHDEPRFTFQNPVIPDRRKVNLVVYKTMNKEYLIYKLADKVKFTSRIDSALFQRYGVKRGLRNEDGSGVLVGLTNIGNVVGYDRDDEGNLIPTEGKLYYRGYELNDLVEPLLSEKRFGFEEIAFLLLSGKLPDREELSAFRELLSENMPLDHRTVVHLVDLEGTDIMNILARCVLEMYTFDENPDDISRDNLMRQAIELIAKFPTIIAYAYNIYRHSVQGRSLHIRHPQEGASIAENFLYMLLHENFTELDARILDMLLIVQAEHGGGNNSTFTVRVTSSTRTDTYSSIAAGIGSLKGPLSTLTCIACFGARPTTRADSSMASDMLSIPRAIRVPYS